MRTTSQLRSLWSPACTAPLTTLTLHSGARISVANAAAEAFRAIDAVMQATGYAPRAADTGAFCCRKITGGSGYSLHAYGIAADYNWNSNPFRADGRLVTDMPSRMVKAIVGIRTKRGQSVFRWGGAFTSVKDAMHFEVVASRTELQSGIDWATVRMTKPDPKKPKTWPVLQLNDAGPTVQQLQKRLAKVGFDPGTIDGHFGADTRRAVRAFQQSRALDVDGTVGLQTWTALLTGQPPTPADKSPVKRDQRPDADPGKLPVLERGDKGRFVERLQQGLNRHGLDPGPLDGHFGESTRKAVLAFQKKQRLDANGVVAERTWKALLKNPEPT